MASIVVFQKPADFVQQQRIFPEAEVLTLKRHRVTAFESLAEAATRQKDIEAADLILVSADMPEAQTVIKRLQSPYMFSGASAQKPLLVFSYDPQKARAVGDIPFVVLDMERELPTSGLRYQTAESYARFFDAVAAVLFSPKERPAQRKPPGRDLGLDL